jgi:hypothetical protein
MVRLVLVHQKSMAGQGPERRLGGIPGRTALEADVADAPPTGCRRLEEKQNVKRLQPVDALADEIGHLVRDLPGFVGQV